MGVDFNDDLLSRLEDFRSSTDGSTGDDVAFFGYGCGFDDGPVEGFLRVAVVFLQGVVPVDEVLREHCEGKGLRKGMMMLERLDTHLRDVCRRKRFDRR